MLPYLLCDDTGAVLANVTLQQATPAAVRQVLRQRKLSKGATVEVVQAATTFEVTVEFASGRLMYWSFRPAS